MNDTVDGRHIALIDMLNILLFTKFNTSQVVVWDFWTINSMVKYKQDKFVILKQLHAPSKAINN